MSWTLDFIRKWSPRMGIVSVMRLYWIETHYRELASGNPEEIIRLGMKSPLRGSISLRKVGSDFATFSEIADQEVYRCVTDLVKDARTIIDLGANIGLASLYFATIYPKARIFAVEPYPRNFELLEKNLAPLISAGRVKVLQAAAWSRHMQLGISDDAPFRYSSVKVEETFESNPSTVMCFPMNDLIDRAGFEEIDLLKMDIEGAETELFKDPGWLQRVRNLAIEFHDDTRRAIGFDELMHDFGFSLMETKHTTVAFRIHQQIRRA